MYFRQFLSTVRLGSCILSTSAVFSAFGARLPVFPVAHFAKVAKLALSGLKQGNFYAPLAGKNNGISRYRAGKQHRLPLQNNAKNIPDTADNFLFFSPLKGVLKRVTAFQG